jgi:hypothetical protein
MKQNMGNNKFKRVCNTLKRTVQRTYQNATIIIRKGKINNNTHRPTEINEGFR